MALGICQRSFFCQLRLSLSFVTIATGQEKAEEWRKKDHNKTEVLNLNSFLDCKTINYSRKLSKVFL